MANLSFRGDAPESAQVETLVVGGTVEVDDLFICTVNGKALSVPAGDTDIDVVAATIATAWNDSAVPEFAEATAAAAGSGGALTITADTGGKALAVTPTTTEAGGGAADTQTFTGSTTTANGGPNAWVAENFTGGALPASGDNVFFEALAVDMLYDLDQSAVTLTELNFEASYAAKAGLPTINDPGDYYEYLPTYLAIGATSVNVGRGTGDGLSRLRLDTGSVQTSITVYKTDSAADENLPAMLHKGSHVSSVLNILGGSVGSALFGGEAAQYASVICTGGSYIAGPGATIATLECSGTGVVETLSAATITTVNKYGTGTLTINGTGAITTLNVFEGKVLIERTGTIAALNIFDGGDMDCTSGVSAFTVTNADFYERCKFDDSHGRITWTNPIQMHGDHRNMDLSFGENRKLKPTT